MGKIWEKYSHRLGPAVLSGLLLGATTFAHASFSLFPWMVFAAFVPLWVSWLQEKNARQIFFAGWTCQFFLSLVSNHWLAHTVNEFSHLGPLLSLLVLFTYSALANLYIPLAGLVWYGTFRHRHIPLWAQLLSLATLTALCERLLPRIFPWHLGYAWLYLGLPGAQFADVIGFRGLGTFTLLLNAGLALAWKERRGRSLFFALAFFAAINLLGWLRLQQVPIPDRLARVLVVQPSVGNSDIEKRGHDDAFDARLLERLFRLTEEGLRQAALPPDFALWPENAFPEVMVDPNLNFRLSKELKKFLVKHELNLLTGSYSLTSLNADRKITNSLFAIGANGSWASAPYNKGILLPFGEYIPGAETFPILKKWLPDVRKYGRGHSSHPLHLAGLRLGAQICYEGLFDRVARDSANAGAQMIVNVTNDSWYGTWMEPWQHLYITLSRAVETRRPVLRGTNSGISTVALSDGSWLKLSPIGEPWVHLYEVPYLEQPIATPFMCWGFYVDYIILIALLAWLSWARRQTKNASAKTLLRWR